MDSRERSASWTPAGSTDPGSRRACGGLPWTRQASCHASPTPLLPPQGAPASTHVLLGGACQPTRGPNPHSSEWATRQDPVFLGHTPVSSGQARAQGSRLTGSSRTRAAHPAECLAVSTGRALGTPAQPSCLGKTSCFLFVSVIRLFSCPAVEGRGSERPASLALPLVVGPAVPKRNLITLFSWFRFCFLIKKMTLLSAGPAALKGVTFKRLRRASQELLGEGGGAKAVGALGPSTGVVRGSWRARPGAAALSVLLHSRQDPSHRSALGAAPSDARWAQGGQGGPSPGAGRGGGLLRIRRTSRPALSALPPSVPSSPSLLPFSPRGLSPGKVGDSPWHPPMPPTTRSLEVLASGPGVLRSALRVSSWLGQGQGGAGRLPRERPDAFLGLLPQPGLPLPGTGGS